MSQTVYNVYEAKSALSSLIERTAAGEEIILAKAGRPMARLGPLPKSPVQRTPGGWEGQVYISEDFDAPLPPEILGGFEGTGE